MDKKETFWILVLPEVFENSSKFKWTFELLAAYVHLNGYPVSKGLQGDLLVRFKGSKRHQKGWGLLCYSIN